jgi:hypothetical protein
MELALMLRSGVPPAFPSSTHRVTQHLSNKVRTKGTDVSSEQVPTTEASDLKIYQAYSTGHPKRDMDKKLIAKGRGDVKSITRTRTWVRARPVMEVVAGRAAGCDVGKSCAEGGCHSKDVIGQAHWYVRSTVT